MSDLIVSSTTDSAEVVAELSAPPIEPKPPEETKLPAPPKEPETDEDDEQDTANLAPKKKGGFQKRIDKLTTRTRELEAEIAALKAPKVDAPAPVEEQPPDPLFFESQADYIAALVKYENGKARKELLNELRTEQVKEVEKNAEVAKANSWKDRVAKAHEDHPDLDSLLDQDLKTSPTVHEVLMDSEVGGELLYYLASHPDELADITAKSPLAAVKALGVIEARLREAAKTPNDPPPVKITQAKKPITPVTGGKGHGSSKSPDEMDLDEYRRWRESNS